MTQHTAEQVFVPDLEIALTATPSTVSLLPGAQTSVWMYRAHVLKGDPASVHHVPNSYLGPIIRAHTGQKLRITYRNELPDEHVSIVHWHGLILPEDMDGHPRHAIRPGQTYVYEFTVKNRAGTYWFHPHPDMQTGRQVYAGLAGLFLVSDDEEAVLGLPSGDQDIPLVIQDRSFDHNNQFVYAAGSPMDGTMEYLMGFLGDRVLVNGRPDYVLEVETRTYRLRLLNGSNTRVYKLAWDDSTPLTVIATDGGLLAHPVECPYVMLAPGERIELWVDFGGRAQGVELRLQSLAFSGAEGEIAEAHASETHQHHTAHAHHEHSMGDMTMTTSATPPLGAPMHILTVRVVVKANTPSEQLPEVLSRIEPYRRSDAVNQHNPRRLLLTQPGMLWEINGHVYSLDAPIVDISVRRGDLEAWEIVNARNDGDTMHPNGMLHPFHIHGVQFQVFERQVLPELTAGWQSVRDGYVDDGWKDTVLLMPGERVTLLLKWSDFSGIFMYHCHILEHEDMGMMGDYTVV